MKSHQKSLIDALVSTYGDRPVTRKEIMAIAEEQGITEVNWLMTNAKHRVGRGLYQYNGGNSAPAKAARAVAPVTKEEPVVESPKPQANVFNMPEESNNVVSLNFGMENGFQENLVPEVDPLFVPFGAYDTLKRIVESGIFYPIFITGLSGNGKTFTTEQVAAKTKREVIRVNFTDETDEDDLIGGFRLVAGETKYFKGPVITAMQRGAILLLDEIDLANPTKIMCLQSILEGKGYFIKKTGEYVTPAPGFTVVATANTKGKGSEDGRFIGTNILNEAFLERFPVTFEQEYPKEGVEKRILKRVFKSLKITEEHSDFIDHLVRWGATIRDTFFDGGVDEVISTRRLVHIAKAFAIFGDRMHAIEMCVNRFDDETKATFIDLYTKIDAEATAEPETEEVKPEFDPENEPQPF